MKPYLRICFTTLILCFCFFLFWQNIWAQNRKASETIKVALLPIIDTLPFYVAEQKGLFKQQGVNAQAIKVASGLDRDQLMQAGAIDGMLNEMMTTANFNRTEPTVKVVMIARAAHADYPMFRMLAGASSGIRSPRDLAGKSIGISKYTIIEYVTDRLLEASGVNPNAVVKKSIPSIPERFQLLIQNQLPVVVLPDPLAKSAMAGGANLVIDDSKHAGFSVSVLSFSVNALQNKAEQVRGFLKAWDLAAEAINQSPEAFRGIMLKKIRVPGNVRNSYPIPYFPRKQVPTIDQWRDVMAWMIKKELLKSPLPFSESVSQSFLP